MGDWLQRAGVKLITSVVGVAIALAWFSFSGGGGDYKELKRLPETVFDGGSGELTFEFKTNQPADLWATFERYSDDDSDEEIAVRREFTPGRYERTVDVGPDTYVYFELKIEEPKVGAEIDWKVYLDGKEVMRESLELDEPLEDGYAFFVQFEADSIEDLRDWLRG